MRQEFLDLVQRAAGEDAAALDQLPGAARRLLARCSQEEEPMALPAPIVRKDFARVIETALADLTVKMVFLFLEDGNCVIRATRRFRTTRRDQRGELLLTYGTPNYGETRTLRRMRGRGEAVPKGIQTKPWPAKKIAAPATKAASKKTPAPTSTLKKAKR